MPSGQSEAFSTILIDKALEYSSWDLLDPQQILFKLHPGSGRVDYLLKDMAQTNSPTVPVGKVISQNPTAGAAVVKGSAVDLMASSGARPVQRICVGP